MEVLHVIPVVQPPSAVRAIETWDTRNVLIVDNTTLGLWSDICTQYNWRRASMHRNLGVAGSWNLGIRWAEQEEAKYVSIISSSVYWREGLRKWERMISDNIGNEWGLLTDQTFHATAWTLETLAPVFDQIGYFDENFYPAYEEDIDFVRRLELSGIHVPPERAEAVGRPTRLLPKVEIESMISCENAVSLKAGAVNVDFGAVKRYYRSKWGGDKHEETYGTPFNLPVPLSWWPVMHGNY